MTRSESGNGPGLPTGTVTFLFSDVVGSSRLWSSDVDGMSASLRIHDEICRGSIRDLGGHIFSIAGDSFGAAFQRTGAALECATRIQQSLAATDWATGPAISVRIGVHVGECEERDGNYFGPVVNESARVMAVANGGQTLLTSAAHETAAIVAVDLGTHTLRDVEFPVHLFQLGEESFPPLRGTLTGLVSLPSPRTSLVGRERAVEEVRTLLAQHRLVTLTGVGGCGKTRLAIEIAHREISAHPQGVWFFDLTTVPDENAVLRVFTSVLGLSTSTDVGPQEQISAYLADRDALLVVDNCEHVVDAVSKYLDLFLERNPRLRILATSRESLECEGECAWKVPSLDIGERAAASSLFVERALAAGTPLGQDDATASIVADIVIALDGIPLAIELAAARSRSMALSELHERLDDRFGILGRGARGRRERQATLEGAVRWSYDLLSPTEQAMLQALSVFQGGFSPSDVVGIANVPEFEAIHRIDSLVAKSLVDVTRDGSGNLRHRLLETIRIFAQREVVEAGQSEALRDRHLEHFRNDPAAATLDAWMSFGTVRRMGREYENFRSAALWALERDRPGDAARIAAMITEAATNRGEVALILEWLRLDTDLPPAEQMIVDTMLAWELLHRGDLATATDAANRAISFAQESPCDFEIYAMVTRSTALGLMSDFMGMVEGFLTAQQLANERYGPNVRGLTDFYLGWLAVLAFQYDVALAQFDVALAQAPDGAYRHIIEANRAWALLCSGAGR